MFRFVPGFRSEGYSNMEKLIKTMAQGCLIIFLISIVGGCLLIFGRFSLLKLDRDSCYKRVGMEFGVSPTYEAISTAIYAKVNTILVPGMNRDEVLNALESVAPVYITKDYQTLYGGEAEYTVLKICNFSENNIGLMIRYTQDGKLEEVRLYIDD